MLRPHLVRRTARLLPSGRRLLRPVRFTAHLPHGVPRPRLVTFTARLRRRPVITMRRRLRRRTPHTTLTTLGAPGK